MFKCNFILIFSDFKILKPIAATIISDTKEEIVYAITAPNKSNSEIKNNRTGLKTAALITP